MSAIWEENLPKPTLKRAEMWCARHWIEARDAGLAALATGDGRLYRRLRHDEQDWFAAMLVVNRILLDIEPLRGEKFMEAAGSR
jgi:hypothetical protein